MTAAPSYPPCIDPSRAKPVRGPNFDRVLRAYMLLLRELRERRLDAADAILADAEPLEDWQSIAEARRGR